MKISTLLIITLLIYLPNDISAAHSAFPYYLFYHSNSAPPLKEHKGFIVTNVGDTISGTILLGKTVKKEKGLFIIQNNQKKFFPISQLNSIRIFAKDSSISNLDYTDFKILGDKPKIWRTIGKGQITVYDELLYTNECIGILGNNISIIENGKMKSTFNFWYRTTKGNLISFINKRYNKKFKARDFSNAINAVRYIVENG